MCICRQVLSAASTKLLLIFLLFVINAFNTPQERLLLRAACSTAFILITPCSIMVVLNSIADELLTPLLLVMTPHRRVSS